MATKFFKKIGIVALAVFLFSSVGVYIQHDLAQAYVRYGPAAQLDIGDIKSSHIMDGTITGVDINQSAPFRFETASTSSFTAATITATSSVTLSTTTSYVLNVGSLTATTSATLPATTFSGQVTLSAGAPTLANHAATKNYVDTNSGNLTISAIAGADIPANTLVAMATSTVAAVNAEGAGATTEGICFGKATLCQEAAQSFTENEQYLTSIAVSLNKTGTPTDNIILKLCISSGADPSCANEIASTTISGASLLTTYATSTWNIYPGVFLGRGVKYWLVADRSAADSDVNFYNIERDNAANNYANGAAAYYGGGSWTHQATWDIKFKMADSGLTAGYVYTTNASSWQSANSTVGYVTTAGATSTQVTVKVMGLTSGLTGLSALAPYYIGNYAGIISATAGITSYQIGTAVGTTSLLIKPARY